jgi:hypothetical protein
MNEDGATLAVINMVKRGDFVKRKPDSKKVYQKGDYDRATKRYSLVDVEDMNREIFVKAGTQVYIGFTY